MYTGNNPTSCLQPPSGHVFSLCVGVVLNSPIPTIAAEDVEDFTLVFQLVPLGSTDVSNLEVQLELMNGTAGKLKSKGNVGANVYPSLQPLPYTQLHKEIAPC